MTDTDRTLADGHWQPLLGRTVAAGGTILVGRLGCGANFGFVLFLLVWLPIVTVWISERSNRERVWIGGLVAALAALLLSGWPIAIAAQLASLLVLFSMTMAAMAVVLRIWMDTATAFAIVSAIWLTWLIGPPLLAGPILQIVSEATFASVLSSHPLVVCNLADTTAGDWTHQAIAYTTLTRLGQDIPFEWPNSMWSAAGLHLVISGLSGAVSWIVPRGTKIATSSLFHVEQ